jgi:hypothetical protein
MGLIKPPVQCVQGIKRPGRETDHSSLSSAGVKNGGAIPPLPDTSSWSGAYLIKLWNASNLLCNEYQGLSSEVMWPQREADYSRPSSVEAKSTWSYTSRPPCFLLSLYGV